MHEDARRKPGALGEAPRRLMRLALGEHGSHTRLGERASPLDAAPATMDARAMRLHQLGRAKGLGALGAWDVAAEAAAAPIMAVPGLVFPPCGRLKGSPGQAVRVGFSRGRARPGLRLNATAGS